MSGVDESILTSDRSAAWRYGVAAVAALAMLGIRIALDPVLGQQSPYLPLALAVIVASRLGGLGPGLAATALSAVSAWYFLLEPRYSFVLYSGSEAAGLAAFVATGIVISLIGGQARTALLVRARSEERLKSAQKALQSSEERLQFATSGTGIGVWSSIPGASDVIVSGSWRDLFGVASDVPVTFETWRGALHPEDRERAVRELNLAAEQHRGFDAEYRVVWPDGTVRWLADRGRASSDGQGGALGMAGVNMDITSLKQTQEALQESEERYRALFNQLIEGFCIIEMIFDAEGKPVDYRFLEFNEAFEGQTGLKDARGRLMSQLAPEHEAYWFEIYGRVALTGEPARFVNEARALNRWYRVNAYRVGGSGSRRVAILFNDITESKRAEDKLRLSEEKFAKAFATNPAALTITRLEDGFMIDANEAWQRVMGHSREEAIGKFALNLHTWPSPEDRARYTAELRKTGSLSGWEATLLRKSGEPFTALLSAVILTMGGEEVILSAWLDISDRKRAEEALRESEKQFRTLANAIPTLCWMANADGWIDWYNDRWYQYTGTTPEQMEGWGWQSVHDPDALPKVLDRWKSSIATAQPFDMVFPLRGADGIFRPFLTRIMPVCDLDGKVARWFGTNTDISEQRKIEETLRRNELEREAAVEFLQIVNANRTTDDLVRAAVGFFREKTGCEAVGVRLKQGEDYPYYETRGFPREFVLLENSLCARNAAGEIVRNAAGYPVYECMCGNVICGRFDAGKPFFSSAGSFWTNHTSELLRGTSEADRQGRTRNRCNGQGYESVALLPLRADAEVLGLLQLNDRRIGMFSPETIALWERLTDYLGVALSKVRAQEALRESEQQYRGLFESMHEAFLLGEMIFDSNGKPQDWRYLDVNPCFENIYGLKREEVVGKTYREVLPGPWSDHWIEKAGRVALTGEPSHFESYSNTGLYLEGSVYRPRPGQFAATISDGTARHDAEERVRQLNAELEDRVRRRTTQLEAANKELEAFAYSVSHDLRAPLRGIDGWSLALVEDYASQLDERAARYVDQVRSEAQRMGRLIDDLLQLSRVTRSEMQNQKVDLEPVAREVAGRLRETNSARRIEFLIGGDLSATGDARLLEIVLTNLFSNAVKFTGPRAEARIEFGRQGDGERAFYVRDNGVGFDMAFAGTLFGAFQRLHKAKEFPGTGIGLATVQRIIHRHGGRVWAQAEPDRGAAFYFTLGES